MFPNNVIQERIIVIGADHNRCCRIDICFIEGDNFWCHCLFLFGNYHNREKTVLHPIIYNIFHWTISGNEFRLPFKGVVKTFDMIYNSPRHSCDSPPGPLSIPLERRKKASPAESSPSILSKRGKKSDHPSNSPSLGKRRGQGMSSDEDE